MALLHLPVRRQDQALEPLPRRESEPAAGAGRLGRGGERGHGRRMGNGGSGRAAGHREPPSPRLPRPAAAAAAARPVPRLPVAGPAAGDRGCSAPVPVPGGCSPASVEPTLKDHRSRRWASKSKPAWLTPRPPRAGPGGGGGREGGAVPCALPCVPVPPPPCPPVGARPEVQAGPACPSWAAARAAPVASAPR